MTALSSAPLDSAEVVDTDATPARFQPPTAESLAEYVSGMVSGWSEDVHRLLVVTTPSDPPHSGPADPSAGVDIGRILIDAADEVRRLHHTITAAQAYRAGLNELWSGRLVSARRTFERALLASGDGFERSRSTLTGWLALLSCLEGRNRSAAELLDAAAMQRPDDPTCAVTRRMLGLEREQCIGRSDENIEAYRQRCDRPDSASVALTAIADLAAGRARLLAGDTAAADRAFVRVAGSASAPPLLCHLGRLARVEAQLLAGAHDLAEAAHGAALAQAPLPALAVDAVLTGRLRLAADRPAEALRAVGGCLAGDTTETRLIDTVTALVIAGAAHRRLGDHARAKELTGRAIALAEPEDLTRGFLDVGRPARSLLTAFTPRDTRESRYRAMLLHQFIARSNSSMRPLSVDVVRLTGSEAAILPYLPTHLRNQEISDQMCLSVNTVKTHLRTLYRKLGVGNRRDAVLTATRLGLL